MIPRAVFVAATLAATLAVNVARADVSPQAPAQLPPAKDANAGPGFVQQPLYGPTPAWFLAQLIPSPEVIAGSQGAAFGMKWELTAISYSWGAYRKLSPWRFGVVDPTARQAGSVELYLAPEYVGTTDNQLFARMGTRTYFPLWERGEFLSASVGASVFEYDSKWGAGYEVGLYGLGGLMGVQVTLAPEHAPLRVITTLALRVF